MPGDLYYGDNLDVMRRHIPSGSVDLIYLDPPFNSDRTYNLIHAGSRRQERAFVDRWTWDEDSAKAFHELTERHPSGIDVPPPLREMMRALKVFLREHLDMLAYLSMMAIRFVETRRVLRNTGSIYVHCDPNASHYLKLILDTIFGPENFRREIVWRSGWVSGFKTKTANWIRNHDTLLYYLRDRREAFTFNKDLAYKPHAEGYERRGGGGNPKGIAIDDVWDEVALYSPWIKSFSTEKLGYMTQKPLALLERVVSVSSNRGDVVLDPFCGCGTTVEAAETLGRKWIGIDMAIRAIGVVRARLEQRFAQRMWTVHGEPADVEQAAHLAETNAYDFRWWAAHLLGGRSRESNESKRSVDSGKSDTRRRGEDGIDHELMLTDSTGAQRRGLVSVNGGRTLTTGAVAAFSDAVQQEKADFGVVVTIDAPTHRVRDLARDCGRVTWAQDGVGKAGHRIRVVTVPEIMSDQVEWCGTLELGRLPSVPAQPQPRAGERRQIVSASRAAAGPTGGRKRRKAERSTAVG